MKQVKIQLGWKPAKASTTLRVQSPDLTEIGSCYKGESKLCSIVNITRFNTDTVQQSDLAHGFKAQPGIPHQPHHYIHTWQDYKAETQTHASPNQLFVSLRDIPIYRPYREKPLETLGDVDILKLEADDEVDTKEKL